jgi:cation transport ATPase
VLVRDVSAFHRIASADVFLFDHHPMLEQAGLEVREVQILDGVPEDDILRLAASAFADLADERSPALHAACAARRIVVRRNPRSSYRGPEITLREGTHSITIRDRRGLESPTDPAPLLEIATDGRPTGRIAFARSSRPRAAESIRQLRQHGPLSIGLISDRAESEATLLAEALGTDFHLSGLSSDGKADAVRSYRRRGHTVAYIGDCRRELEAARAADVAISLADPLAPERDPAQVLVLRSDLDWAAGLRDRAHSHVARIRTIHGAILVPNLFCIAGAFFLGFTSMSAVVLSNLGTLAVYCGLPHQLYPRGTTPHRRELPGSRS